MYVVPTRSMTAELILGHDFLKSVEVIIQRGRIEIKRPSIRDADTSTHEKTATDTDDQCNNKETFQELAAINCVVAEEITV